MSHGIISPPFDQLSALCAELPAALLTPEDFAQFNAALAQRAPDLRFVEQDEALLADGRNFEQRIAEVGTIATRAGSLHDYYSALMWLRFPHIKQAIHTLQMHGIREHGVKQRSRHQQAITHLDEAGAWIVSDSQALFTLADQHAWTSLFWEQRRAWRDGSELGRIRAMIFGHAIYELMHQPHQTLAAKTIWLFVPSAFFALAQATQDAIIDQTVSAALLCGSHGSDPKPLATLPLAGIPGWDAQSEQAEFFQTAPCFRAKPAGRIYAPAIILETSIDRFGI